MRAALPKRHIDNPRFKEMKTGNKYFLILLGIAASLVMGVIAENTRSVLIPANARIKIDVEKVKKQISDAGLTPQEAKYWKEIP